MATTRSALTDEDIRTLVKGATPDERAVAARKLCNTMDRTRLSDEDRALAADILRVMAADAAELVRKAIAETLQASDVVPRDVALKLALIQLTFTAWPAHTNTAGQTPNASKAKGSSAVWACIPAHRP